MRAVSTEMNRHQQTPFLSQYLRSQTLYGLHMLDVALFTLRGTRIARMFEDV
jgi:hypothetical protein